MEATGYPFLKEDFERNGGIYSEEPVVIGKPPYNIKVPERHSNLPLAIVRNVKGAENGKRYSVKAWWYRKDTSYIKK